MLIGIEAMGDCGASHTSLHNIGNQMWLMMRLMKESTFPHTPTLASILPRVRQVR